MRQGLRLWLPAMLLGLATIGAYGTVQYSIGVLIPSISDDTGWRTGSISTGFSLGVLGQGAVALIAGRTFDRKGSRPMLLIALAAGVVLLSLAAHARTPTQFVMAWALGSAAIGGGLYYSMTMPVTARLYVANRTAAFSVLTLLGALASPIFSPLTAWLCEIWGWRTALQTLVLLSAICVAPAALLVNAPAAARASASGPGTTQEVRAALRHPAVHRTIVVISLAAFANSALLLHQVGAIESAGLSAALASSFAGARGAFQIPGRLLLTPLTSRFGVRVSIGLCYALAATAAVALLIAVGGHATRFSVVYFAAVGGMSLGLLSPLTGLFQADVYGDERLGTLSGVGVLAISVSAAAGAWFTGQVVDITGSYRGPLAVILGFQVLAIFALRWQHAAEMDTTQTLGGT